jgi:hypothetical protein
MRHIRDLSLSLMFVLVPHSPAQVWDVLRRGRLLTGRALSLQALRRAVPLLHYRRLETFREGFVAGRPHFSLEELILAALADPALTADAKKAEAEARSKPKPARKGGAGSMTRSGEVPEYCPSPLLIHTQRLGAAYKSCASIAAIDSRRDRACW